MLYPARTLVSIWALFWIWFGIASGIGEHGSFGEIAMHTAVPGLVFALIAGIAWKRELAGGIALLGITALVGAAYPCMFKGRPLAVRIPTILALASPTLVAGVLFLVAGYKLRRSLRA